MARRAIHIPDLKIKSLSRTSTDLCDSSSGRVDFRAACADVYARRLTRRRAGTTVPFSNSPGTLVSLIPDSEAILAGIGGAHQGSAYRVDHDCLAAAHRRSQDAGRRSAYMTEGD